MLSELLYRWLIVCINDCIPWSSSLEEALLLYEQLLATSIKFALQFKPSKSSVESKNLEVLGHRTTPQGRLPTKKGFEAFLDMPRPTTVNGQTLSWHAGKLGKAVCNQPKMHILPKIKILPIRLNLSMI